MQKEMLDAICKLKRQFNILSTTAWWSVPIHMYCRVHIELSKLWNSIISYYANTEIKTTPFWISKCPKPTDMTRIVHSNIGNHEYTIFFKILKGMIFIAYMNRYASSYCISTIGTTHNPHSIIRLTIIVQKAIEMMIAYDSK